MDYFLIFKEFELFGGDFFMFIICGESMINIGIMNGD